MQQPDGDKTGDKTRVAVPKAAQALGISEEAVRARIKRGTLPHVKDPDGSVFVLLDADQARQDTDKTNAQALIIQRLENEVGFLRGELERKDAILLTLARRVPELEPARDASESPVKAAGDADRGTGPDEPKKGFWAKLFGR